MLTVLFLLHESFGMSFSNTVKNEIKLESNDNILILAPHPDDETIGCGGVIYEAVCRKIPVHVAFLTSGDSNEMAFYKYEKHPVIFPSSIKRMGELRMKEACAAIEKFGLSLDAITFLGYPDFGTLEIWKNRWGERIKAYKSLLTRSRVVPYPEAMNPGALYTADNIYKDINTLIDKYVPTKIFVSHPGDLNQDHRALYLFTRAVLLGRESAYRPEIYCYLVHYKKWPNGSNAELQFEQNPKQSFVTDYGKWTFLHLDKDAETQKKAAINMHKTQMSYGKDFLLSFVQKKELFWKPPYGGTGKVSVQKGKITISILLPRHVIPDASVNIYIFGFNKDIPFTNMPKIHIIHEIIGNRLYDQDKKFVNKKIEINKTKNRIDMQIPVSIIKNPKLLFIGVETSLFDKTIDVLPWNEIKVD